MTNLEKVPRSSKRIRGRHIQRNQKRSRRIRENYFRMRRLAKQNFTITEVEGIGDDR